LISILTRRSLCSPTRADVIFRWRGSVIPKIWVEVVLAGALGFTALGLTDGGFFQCDSAGGNANNDDDDDDDDDDKKSPCGYFYIPPDAGARHQGHSIIGVLLAL
jgi:hypothetical protein